VRFLALLELYKQGLVELDQADRFGDIVIEWIAERDVTDAVVATHGFGLGIDDYEG
jgi:segregation and condensation protein A